MGFRETVLRPAKLAVQNMRYFSFRSEEHIPFIVITKERSGSTVFMDLLSRHPKMLIDCHDFFSPDKWPAYLDKKSRIHSRKPVRGVKFKICNDYTGTSVEQQTAFIRERHRCGVRLIRLNRKSYLKQAISYVMTGQTSRLHYHQDTREVVQFEIDLDRFVSAARYYHELSQREVSALAGLPHLDLCYEEVFEQEGGKQLAADACFDFLGVESIPVDTTYRKPKRPRLREMLLNFDDFKAEVEKLPFLDMNDVL